MPTPTALEEDVAHGPHHARFDRGARRPYSGLATSLVYREHLRGWKRGTREASNSKVRRRAFLSARHVRFTGQNLGIKR